jgi:RNA recognition motif-containing protein
VNTKVYFDNLPATVTENELMELFAAHGNVVDIHIFADHAGAESRSYGFVTMITPEGAREAIKSISGKAFGIRTIVLSEVAPIRKAAASESSRKNPRRMMSRLF